MSDNVVVPLGGAHKSARSLLAEAMNDPRLDHCVLICFDKDGSYGFSHFGMSRERMCFAAELIIHRVFASEGLDGGAQPAG
jgi:hypothetical protein